MSSCEGSWEAWAGVADEKGRHWAEGRVWSIGAGVARRRIRLKGVAIAVVIKGRDEMDVGAVRCSKHLCGVRRSSRYSNTTKQQTFYPSSFNPLILSLYYC